LSWGFGYHAKAASQHFQAAFGGVKVEAIITQALSNNAKAA